jgi:RNA polymerase sigma-70 factor (ECF subfamily)
MPTPDLLPRIASGDRSAVAETIDRYGPSVRALARRALGAEADDAVQDVFVAVWQSAGRFDPSLGSELTFVMTLARRKVIDRLRSKSRRPDFAPLPAEPFSASDPSVDPDLADSAAKARQALSQLRPEERNILELSLLQGLSQTEVAERTSLPLGTVKTHARRGLIRLRALLGISAADDTTPIRESRSNVPTPTPNLRLAGGRREAQQ